MDPDLDNGDFSALVEELKDMGFSEPEAMQMAKEIIENEQDA